MREVDRVMIEELGVLLVRMMENAGRNLALLARFLLSGDARGRRILVLAGRGGNGGGGLVAARHLVVAGADVEVRLSEAPEELATVTAEQLAIVQRIGVPVSVGAAGDLGQPDLVLDCVLGYGQNGAARGATASLIERCGGLRVLALDVPSGLELETGVLYDSHIRAEATLTLACPKEGLRAPGAGDAVGALYVADISVPERVYGSLGVPYTTPFGRNTIVRIET
jgi:NAD(P)H-hydrate epimerase